MADVFITPGIIKDRFALGTLGPYAFYVSGVIGLWANFIIRRDRLGE
jgi:hypothetical protein